MSTTSSRRNSTELMASAKTSVATSIAPATTAGVVSAPIVEYPEVLRFMCAYTRKNYENTVGYEFNGADYCRVLRACCPALVDMQEVCWFPETVATQDADNLTLFIAYCESLNLETFPAGLTPASLHPSIEKWTNHALVQSFLHRLAVSHLTPTDHVDYTKVPTQCRCESGIMQFRAAHAAALKSIAANATPPTSRPGSQRSSIPTTPPVSQPQPAAPLLTSSTLGPRASNLHAADEHLDEEALLAASKGHLVMQAQLKEYRRALRSSRRHLMQMLATGGSVDWEALSQTAAVEKPYDTPAYA